jgi:hypothetical protein
MTPYASLYLSEGTNSYSIRSSAFACVFEDDDDDNDDNNNNNNNTDEFWFLKYRK